MLPSSKERRYIEQFIKLKCAPDLLIMDVFPNAKEITESFAAYNAVANFIPRFDFADSEVVLLSVADGNTPRTASVFAYMTRWTCYSIDPRLKSTGRWKAINRLHIFQGRIEAFKDHILPPTKLVIVCVHPHVELQAVLDATSAAADRALVSIPCCVKQHLPGAPPDYDYIDEAIWSPKNRVLVWNTI